MPIDEENMGDVALYIEDITHGPVTVCGTVTEILEKETKNGKPFYIFSVNFKT